MPIRLSISKAAFQWHKGYDKIVWLKRPIYLLSGSSQEKFTADL